MNKKTKQLIQLVKEYIEKSDSLFFPEGYYGGECYLLDEDGFYGPHRIPEYVVPVEFSEKAESEFLKKIDEAGLDIDESESEVLEVFCEGIDLSHGDQGWDLEPFQFIDILKNSCQADTLYLPSEWEYGDFLEACTANLTDFPLVAWDSVTNEDINEWISMIDDALKLKS